MEDTPKKYEVPEENLATLRARIARLARRAVKLGSEEISLIEHSVREVTVKPENGFSFQRRIHTVSVSGSAPRIAGWQFAAVLSPVPSETGETLGNVLRIVPGFDSAVPEKYRTAGNNCDHCHTERRRNETFVLVSDTGEWKQVGRQCLRDFLGHASPELYASLAEILISARELCELSEGDGYFGASAVRRWSLEEVLNVATCAVRVLGWTSRSEAKLSGGPATADDVHTWMTISGDSQRKWNKPLNVTDEDKATAQEVIAWLESLSSESSSNDYIYNLSLLGRGAVISFKEFGLACSAVPSYLRVREREINRQKRFAEDAASQFVGTVGKREAFAVTLVYTNTFESQFGVTHLYKFKDDAGNILTWFASNRYYLPEVDREIDAGDRIVVNASVKKHETYKGINQTVVTRCTPYVDPATKKAQAKARKAQRAAEQAQVDQVIAEAK